MIRFLTAGESHGDRLAGIIEGFPANLEIDLDRLNHQLRRRQMGYGRSKRMDIESDRLEIISGLRNKKTTGNPIAFTIKNKGLNIPLPEVLNPRPGHADLVGILKYNQEGARNSLERSSARETATRVAVGAFCREFLDVFGVEILSHVVGVGGQQARHSYYRGLDLDRLRELDSSSLRVVDREDERAFIGEIDRARDLGDSLGGNIEVIVRNLPIGLGSFSNWDRKLDAILAYYLMGVQAIKSVEFGLGKESSSLPGSKYHDEIYYRDGIRRSSNSAGGIEGGVSNGEDLVINLSMKPIPTLKAGLKTINIASKEEALTRYERSDVCAVTAASIVCESVVAIALMEEFLRLFAGDFMEEIVDRYNNYMKYIKER